MIEHFEKGHALIDGCNTAFISWRCFALALLNPTAYFPHSFRSAWLKHDEHHLPFKRKKALMRTSFAPPFFPRPWAYHVRTSTEPRRAHSHRSLPMGHSLSIRWGDSPLYHSLVNDWSTTPIAAGIVILIYDHILTLKDELRLLWKTPGWSLNKVALLHNRYVVEVALALAAYGRRNPSSSIAALQDW